MPNNLTNQELLKELEQRLSDFTQGEFLVLMKLMEQHKEIVLKIIQLSDPKIYSWIQEKYEQLEQEKVDEQVKEIKKKVLNEK